MKSFNLGFIVIVLTCSSVIAGDTMNTNSSMSRLEELETCNLTNDLSDIWHDGPCLNDDGSAKCSRMKRKLAELKESAESGDAESQYDLAVCYNEGHAVAQDYEQSLIWARRAADQGHAKAQVLLGMNYAIGLGVPQDAEAAVFWFNKAKDNGSSKAIALLGLHYLEHQESDKAFSFFKQAAELGNDMGQFYTAYCYFSAIGVSKDDDIGAEWMLKSAEQGFALAQVQMAVCYITGRGVPEDDIEGCAWAYVAAQNGIREPLDGLQKILPMHVFIEGMCKGQNKLYGTDWEGPPSSDSPDPEDVPEHLLGEPLGEPVPIGDLSSGSQSQTVSSVKTQTNADKSTNTVMEGTISTNDS